MRPLQNLPVWVVVRLCTDEDSVVDYWNKVDEVSQPPRARPCSASRDATAAQ